MSTGVGEGLVVASERQDRLVHAAYCCYIVVTSVIERVRPGGGRGDESRIGVEGGGGERGGTDQPRKACPTVRGPVADAPC